MLTVMFCDLVGSTALGERLDPEDFRNILAKYQSRATEIIEAAGGLVARLSGDGVLAYFGYPQASEDDAERAVKGGLQLVKGIKKFPGIPVELSVRVGIATGVVLIGDLLHSSAGDNPAIVGQTPNTAARLQALAEPDTVVIASSTRRLTGGLFKYHDLGMRQLKGFAEPVGAWQVLDASDVANRFEALRSQHLPVIGRDEELDLLLRRWANAKNGEGRVVVFSGEAGIGKSRITIALEQRLQGMPCERLRYFCSPHHRDSTLHPFIVQLQRAAGLDSDDTPEAKLDKLEALLARSSDNPPERAALLADLLGLPSSNRYTPFLFDTRRKRLLTLASLMGQLEDLARKDPVLIVFEDVQWIDPTSFELLEMAVECAPRIPVLLLITCRPEFQAPWVGLAHVTTLAMRRLSQLESANFVQCIVGNKALPPEIVEQIAERSDGIPLFVEELTKTCLDSVDFHELDGRYTSAGPVKPIAIPSSLQALLMTRLDSLGPAKEVAQIGAAVGREFSYEVLAAVAQCSQERLRDSLDRLLGAGLVFRRGVPQREKFIFKHSLIQDAAYSTLLREQRKDVHTRIACALEQFPDTVEMQPEILAHHCEQAGLHHRSIEYWLKAGQRAADRSAHVEAVKHFSEGIRLAGELPPSPERTRKELDLHVALGPALMATNGYAAPESLRVYMRERDLIDLAGNDSELLHVHMGLFNVHYNRAELKLALATAQQHLAIAERQGRHEGRAHVLLGQTYSAMGAFLHARRHLHQALDLFAGMPESGRSSGANADQHVVALSLIAGVHFALGYSQQAMAATAAAVDRARKIDHSLTTALALVIQLLTPIPGGLEADAVRANEVVRFCSQHRLKNFEAWARFAQGAIVARRGQLREGISVMRAAVDAAEAMSSRLFRPVHLASIASAHAKLGEVEEGLRLVTDAILIADSTGERQAEAALYRLHGEILSAAGNVQQGEHELMRALEVARAQHAISEELRVASSIAGLLRGQGRQGEALAILSPVYDRCSSGFDPPSLQSAHRLRDELRRHLDAS